MLQRNCPSHQKEEEIALLSSSGNDKVVSTSTDTICMKSTSGSSQAVNSLIENCEDRADNEPHDLTAPSVLPTQTTVISGTLSHCDSLPSKGTNLNLNPCCVKLSKADNPGGAPDTWDELREWRRKRAHSYSRACMHDSDDDDDDEEEEDIYEENVKNISVCYQEVKEDVKDEKEESGDEVAITREEKESSSDQSINAIPALQNDFPSVIPGGSSSTATKETKHPDSRICKGTLLFEHRAKISVYASHWTSCQDCIKFWKLRRLEAKLFNGIKISLHLHRDLCKKEGMLSQVPLRYPKEICYRLFDILPKKMPVVYYNDLLNNAQIVQFRTYRIRCPEICKNDVSFPIVDVASSSIHSCNPRNIETDWRASRSAEAIKMERGCNFKGKVAVFTFTRHSKGHVNSKNQAKYLEQHKFCYDLAKRLLVDRLNCSESNIKHAQQYHKSGLLESTIVKATIPTPDTYPFMCISEQWNDDDVFGTYDHYYMSIWVTSDFSCSPYYFLEWIDSLTDGIQAVRLLKL